MTVNRSYLFLIVFFSTISCCESYSSSSSSIKYTRNAINIIRNNALYSNRIDWKNIEKQISTRKPDLSISEGHKIVSSIVSNLFDGHSQFLLPEQAKLISEGAPSPGFSILFLGGQKLVYAVERNSKAWRLGLRGGEIITKLYQIDKENLYVQWKANSESIKVSAAKFKLAKLERPLLPIFHQLPGGIVKITIFSTANWFSKEKQEQYAQEVHTSIKAFEKFSSCGWIINLQENDGGSTSAILLALGPLLGNNKFEYFNPNKIESAETFLYKNGELTITEKGKVSESLKVNSPAKTIPETMPVALLQGAVTASAAEAALVAFKGRPNTRTFGNLTAGVPTGNETYELADKALLILTQAVAKNRLGDTYSEAIEPDVLSGKEISASDTTEVARKWVISKCKQ